MRIEDIPEGSLWHFLLEASKRHPGDDWVERYTDYAERRFAGINRADFIRRLREAKKAHSLAVAQSGWFRFLWEWPFHNWIRWYARHMLANAAKPSRGAGKLELRVFRETK